MNTVKTLFQGLAIVAALSSLTVYADEPQTNEKTQSDENFSTVSSNEMDSEENFKAIANELEAEAKNS